MKDKITSEKIFSVFLKALFALPLLLGVYGLAVLEGEPLLDSLFASVTMYFVNYGDVPPNIFVEIARWTALIADLGILVSAVIFLREKAGNLFKSCIIRKSVAVYGAETEKKTLLRQLKWYCRIDGGNGFVRAQQYILLNNETANFDFYNKHRDKPEEKNGGKKSRMFYIKADPMWTRFVDRPDVKLFSPEESAARLFWKSDELWGCREKCPYALIAGKAEPELDIVLIGFGKLGEELIYWGLQNNIFFADQRIRYHVFGDCAGFISTHTELEHISDKIFQHTEPWTDQVGFIEKADLVLVPEQREQDALLKDLLFVTVRKDIYVFAPNASLFAELKKTEGFDRRFIIFPWQEESYKWENIEKDLLFKNARAVNELYNRQVKDLHPEYVKEWEELDAFTKYSNVSTADYDEIWRRILEYRDIPIPENKDGISAALRDEMAELEHIRWCRYHWLNNWKAMERSEGSPNKDKENRTHVDLVDYRRLSEASRDKDREIAKDRIARLRLTGKK